jgi:hypothetical protein
MMRSCLLTGFLAALCHPAYGAVFHDKITQIVGDNTLSLLHDVGDPTTVRFGIARDSESQAWKLDTLGFHDDEVVITPLNSSKTLVCEPGSKCRLDLEGSKQLYRITRVETEIFTFQDIVSSLYLSRAPDLDLKLTTATSDSIYFALAKI